VLWKWVLLKKKLPNQGQLFFSICLSRPEIATIHKTLVMEENTNYVKRSQRDYSMSLKLQIVSESAEVYPLPNQKKIWHTNSIQWFNGYENLVALIGKTKHHNMSNHRTKIMGLKPSKATGETEVILGTTSLCS
jgi:hypothetical protein